MMKVIELHASATASNDLDAAALREELKDRGILLINLMSSPGSGKTTLLSRLIRDFQGKLRIAVLIEGRRGDHRIPRSSESAGAHRRHVPHGRRDDGRGASPHGP